MLSRILKMVYKTHEPENIKTENSFEGLGATMVQVW
jgi:hypothetical protein